MNSEYTRIVRLAVLGSISIMPLLVLPTMVGALVDLAGFTESQAGWVAAVGGAGGALAAIVFALRIRHLDPQRLAVAGLLSMLFFDTASALLVEQSVGLFLACRMLSGIGGAAAYAAVMATYASMPNSERGYGTFMVFQFGLSAVGLYLLPMALPVIGITGMYIGMAIGALFGLSQVTPLNRKIQREGDSKIEFHMLIRPAALLIMLSIGLFEIANNMHFTYTERIGVAFALSDHQIGVILAVTTLLGIPAAFAVVWLGDRYGEMKPIVFALALAIVGLFILLFFSGTFVYALAMSVLSVAWAFGLPYFQAFEARLDPGGSVVVAGGFFTAAGGALGPALAAMLVLAGDYSGVLVAALVIYAVIIGLVIVSTRLARKASA